jgi:hypothetical protein
MDEFVYPIQWMNPEHFRGRFIRIDSIGDDGEIKIGEKIPIDDDDIVCDQCNAAILDFPCPVVKGYALCGPQSEDCRKRWAIEPGDTEYFESFCYNVGVEEPKPRVNFGGRK